MPLFLLLCFEIARAYWIIPVPILPTENYVITHKYCVTDCETLKAQCKEWNSLSYPKFCVYICDTLSDENFENTKQLFDCVLPATDACQIQSCKLACTPPQIL